MNIGFLSASLSRKAGGVYDAARLLALGLYSAGCEVQVFGLHDEFTECDISGWGNLKAQALQVHGPRPFGYAPGLNAALRCSNVELLHSHGLWMYPSRASLKWSRATGHPHMISPHGMLDSWAVSNSRWKKRLAGWLYEDAHLRSAACIHALCESEVAAIRAHGLSNPICVIPNGVELPAAGGIEAEPGWGMAIPDGAKVLLYLGRIHPKKGLLELIRGWQLFTEQRNMHEEWHLVIAGWDQAGHKNELATLVANLRHAGRVHFVGPQFDRDKQLTYKRADAFVLPSFSEGLPMVVLEAWSHGLPVLMTPQCNLPEGFSAQAAIQIEAAAESISDGLRALFSLSENERLTMGLRGLQLVKDKFTWPRIALQMNEVYRWILGQSLRPSCVKFS